MMEAELVKKQNRKVTIFAIILSIISFGLLIFGFILVSSDKVVMLQSISNLSNKLDGVLDSNSSFINKLSTSKDIGFNGNFKINSNQVNTEILIDYLENKKDKKSKLDFDIFTNDESLLELDLALENDNIYLYLSNITPNYYHTTLDYFSFLSGLSETDYEKLITLLKETVTDYINDDEIEKKKVDILYQKKDKRVNKLSYKITNNTIIGIATNFINSIKRDKMLLEHISSYMNINTDEVIDNLDEKLKLLINSDEKIEYYYHVYYYGFNKIIQYELENVDTKSVISYKIDNSEVINFYRDDVNVLSLDIVDDKERWNFTGFVLGNNNEKYSFSGNLENNILTLILNQEKDIKVVITSLKEEKDNAFTYRNNIVISEIVDGLEKKLSTVDLNSEYYFNKKVDINITNSTGIDAITDDDIATVQNNFMNHPLYQLIDDLIKKLNISL